MTDTNKLDRIPLESVRKLLESTRLKKIALKNQKYDEAAKNQDIVRDLIVEYPDFEPYITPFATALRSLTNYPTLSEKGRQELEDYLVRKDRDDKISDILK